MQHYKTYYVFRIFIKTIDLIKFEYVIWKTGSICRSFNFSHPCFSELLLMQAVIDANIIPPLVALLATAEFDIKKEAAWAISNATSGGTHEQIK